MAWAGCRGDPGNTQCGTEARVVEESCPVLIGVCLVEAVFDMHTKTHA